MNSLYNFIEAFPKRHALFIGVQREADSFQSDTRKTLKLLSETRWASRFNAVNATFVNYDTIAETLERLTGEHGKVAVEAHSLMQSCGI